MTLDLQFGISRSIALGVSLALTDCGMPSLMLAVGPFAMWISIHNHKERTS